MQMLRMKLASVDDDDDDVDLTGRSSRVYEMNVLCWMWESKRGINESMSEDLEDWRSYVEFQQWMIVSVIQCLSHESRLFGGVVVCRSKSRLSVSEISVVVIIVIHQGMSL